MRNNRLLGICLGIGLCTSAVAGHYYVGPTVLVRHLSASNSSANSLQTRMSLGYGNAFDDYYLGGELFITPYSHTLADSQNPGSANAKTTTAFGLSFIPGMKLDETVVGFLRLGVISTKFSGVNTNKLGGQIGAGFQVPLSLQWDFRAEYIHTVYRSMGSLGSPKSDEVGLGAIYKFGA